MSNIHPECLSGIGLSEKLFFLENLAFKFDRSFAQQRICDSFFIIINEIKSDRSTQFQFYIGLFCLLIYASYISNSILDAAVALRKHPSTHVMKSHKGHKTAEQIWQDYAIRQRKELNLGKHLVVSYLCSIKVLNHLCIGFKALYNVLLQCFLI